jgi:membrane protein implicated in regulation of membrane protease activity
MNGDVISSWAWIVWIALILLFAVIEMLSLDFTFLMLSLGSVGGLVSGLLGAPWWVQIIVAGVLAVILLFGVRPPLHRRLHRGGDPAKSNVDALLGQAGTVVRRFADGAGQVKLANGETWTSRVQTGSAAPALDEGDRVVVIAIEGATAVVAPAERTVS